MRLTLDANVLVYTLNEDDRRHPEAVMLLKRAATADCVQPMQTFGEFFHVVTRKYRCPAGDAVAAIRRFRDLVDVAVAEEDDFDEALRTVTAHRLQFWDALILATARRAGSSILFTEDLNDGQTVDGVRIVNPFVEANRDLVDLILLPAKA